MTTPKLKTSAETQEEETSGRDDAVRELCLTTFHNLRHDDQKILPS